MKNIDSLGGNAFALFLKNQRRWTSKPYEQKNIDGFHENCKEYGFDPKKHILPHSSYLINLGNPDEEKRMKAFGAFEDDLERCEKLGIGLYNIHPGSSLGTDRDKAIERIAECINKAHGNTSFVKVVLENMAGQGQVIGSYLEDLQKIIDLTKDKSRIGVCIDTCHAFASGYDLRTEKVFNEFWENFDRTVGYKYLSGIHLNDSKGPLASTRDLHQQIGLGFLGLETFRLIMNKEELQDLPIVLETPLSEDSKKGDRDSRGDEIKLLEWLTGKSADDPEVLKKSKELQALGAKERKEQQDKFDQKQTKGAKAQKTNRKINFKPTRPEQEEDDEEE